MNQLDDLSWASRIEVAGHRLGDPIRLEDLLALPPDDRRYVRDACGRLALQVPESARSHHFPLSSLLGWFCTATRPPVFPCSRPGIAFRALRRLDGWPLAASALGPCVLVPDIAVFSSTPGFVEDGRAVDAAALAVVVEIVSPCTWRRDVGLGDADEVDRFSSYLESGAPEYWVLNPTTEALALPPRTGLFLRASGERWLALEGDALVHGDGQVHGFRPIASGRLRSPALGVEVDLAALWERLTPPT